MRSYFSTQCESANLLSDTPLPLDSTLSLNSRSYPSTLDDANRLCSAPPLTCPQSASALLRPLFHSSLLFYWLMASEPITKKVVPKVVKLDKAFKLAEIWVKNMSGGTATETLTDMDTEGRPSRLGLGARIIPNAQRAPSTDPVERKLLGKVNAKRKQSLENEEKMNSGEKNELENEDDTDESESRTNAVAKKRLKPLPTAALVKRHK